jgi:hypothetical protein
MHGELATARHAPIAAGRHGATGAAASAAPFSLPFQVATPWPSVRLRRQIRRIYRRCATCSDGGNRGTGQVASCLRLLLAQEGLLQMVCARSCFGAALPLILSVVRHRAFTWLRRASNRASSIRRVTGEETRVCEVLECSESRRRHSNCRRKWRWNQGDPGPGRRPGAREHEGRVSGSAANHVPGTNKSSVCLLETPLITKAPGHECYTQRSGVHRYYLPIQCQSMTSRVHAGRRRERAPPPIAIHPQFPANLDTRGHKCGGAPTFLQPTPRARRPRTSAPGDADARWIAKRNGIRKESNGWKAGSHGNLGRASMESGGVARRAPGNAAHLVGA